MPQVLLDPIPCTLHKCAVPVHAAQGVMDHLALHPLQMRRKSVRAAQVVLELVELREVDTARAMLRQTAVFAGMKQEEPDRFLRLEHLCGRAYFDVRRAVGPHTQTHASHTCS